MDPVLRLRCVLQPRHRHPNRPDGSHAAAARAEGGRLNIRIRRATDADLPALTDLRHDWTAEWYGPSEDAGYEGTFAAWWRTEADHRLMWLASDGGAAVGMLNLVEFRRMPRPGRAPSGWGYVSNVYVRPEYRGRGIGKQLLAAAIAEAGRRGYDRLVLNPSERSRTLYTRAGFVPAGDLLVRRLPREG